MIEETKSKTSEISLQIPQRISRITTNRRTTNNDESLLRALEYLSNQPNGPADSTLNSRHSRNRNNLSYSNASTIKRKRKHLRKRKRKLNNKKRLNPRSHDKNLIELIGKTSDFTEIGNIALNDLLRNNLSSKLHDIESCNESEQHDEVQHINNIQNIEQKVKVSNVNCSCRVF